MNVINNNNIEGISVFKTEFFSKPNWLQQSLYRTLWLQVQWTLAQLPVLLNSEVNQTIEMVHSDKDLRSPYQLHKLKLTVYRCGIISVVALKFFNKE